MLIRDEKTISEKVGSLGIPNDYKIIFYDNTNAVHTSCRALWMFKVFGHHTNQLYILDGGFDAWKNYGGKVESGERAITPKSYQVTFEAHFIRTLMQMKTNLHHPAEQVVDVRHPVRYAGGKELRVHMRFGHIPGSYSFPYFTMFEPDGRFKPLGKIRKQFTGIGVELEYPIVTMCGSGISSAILNFVLDLMGHEKHAIYDGSWAEWGYDETYPGEKDLAERPVVTSLET
jgi:thiosulfate/3-mercaptopyruvate sulfurtransferase